MIHTGAERARRKTKLNIAYFSDFVCTVGAGTRSPGSTEETGDVVFAAVLNVVAITGVVPTCANTIFPPAPALRLIEGDDGNFRHTDPDMPGCSLDLNAVGAAPVVVIASDIYPPIS